MILNICNDNHMSLLPISILVIRTLNVSNNLLQAPVIQPWLITPHKRTPSCCTAYYNQAMLCLVTSFCLERAHHVFLIASLCITYIRFNKAVLNLNLNFDLCTIMLDLGLPTIGNVCRWRGDVTHSLDYCIWGP